MTEDIKNRVKSLIVHDGDDKVKLFLDNFRIVKSEMSLQMELHDRKLHFLLFFQDEISSALIFLSFCLNFIIAISLEKGYFSGNSSPQFSSELFYRLTGALQVIQTCGYLLGLMQALILVVPVARDEWYELSAFICSSSTIRLSRMEKLMTFLKHYSTFVFILLTGTKWLRRILLLLDYFSILFFLFDVVFVA